MKKKQYDTNIKDTQTNGRKSKPQNEQLHLWSNDLQQGFQDYSMAKTLFSNLCIWKIGYQIEKE